MSWILRVSVSCWSAVVLAGPGLMLGSAMAEQAKKPAAAPAEAPLEFQVIRLRFVKASDTARLLTNFFEDSIRLLPDERTNSLVVRASVAKITEMQELLRKIDIEGADAEAPPPRISIFELRAIEADKALEDALKVVALTQGGMFAVDKAHKRVVVSADRNTTQAVEALLSRLDILGASRPDDDVQVRVVWLADAADMPAKVGRVPPSDLREVLPGMVKLGIQEPRVLAQFVANAQANKRFEIKGTVGNDQVSVSGRLNSRTQPPGMEIAIKVLAEGGGLGKRESCNLQTEISAPSGHFVVLGVSPVGQTSWAFVVQMLRKEGKPAAPTK